MSAPISQRNEAKPLASDMAYRSAFEMRADAAWKFVLLFQSGTASRKPSCYEIRRIATPTLALPRP